MRPAAPTDGHPRAVDRDIRKKKNRLRVLRVHKKNILGINVEHIQPHFLLSIFSFCFLTTPGCTPCNDRCCSQTLFFLPLIIFEMALIRSCGVAMETKNSQPGTHIYFFLFFLRLSSKRSTARWKPSVMVEERRKKKENSGE